MTTWNSESTTLDWRLNLEWISEDKYKYFLISASRLSTLRSSYSRSLSESLTDWKSIPLYTQTHSSTCMHLALFVGSKRWNDYHPMVALWQYHHDFHYRKWFCSELGMSWQTPKVRRRVWEHPETSTIVTSSRRWRIIKLVDIKARL